MFFSLLIISIYYHHHLLLHLTSASSLLYTLNDVRYMLSDRILTIPKLGSIRGISIDYENNYSKKYNLVNVEAYLGIEYGFYSGRFQPSKEKFYLYSNTKVNKQIEYGSACSQHIWNNNSTDLIHIRNEYFVKEYYPKLLKFIVKQNEQQCLYMNIYQPQMKDLKERLPVLLFIHGDGYDMGTGAAFDGAIFASYTKTIVVTINYRLGPFGFLYVSKENKGDYALQDIYTALHWLKNYILHFNGDPNRITLYGTGSGAVLASLVVMLETVNGGTGTIKRRKSLVHRLILNDQTFLSPDMTSTYEEISPYQKNLLSKLSCSTFECLCNESLITTADFLKLNSYSNENPYKNSICPLESPFPFIDDLSSKYLRRKFSENSQIFLPENLSILLTTTLRKSYSFLRKTSVIIEYLLNYAYTRWNKTLNQYEFDQQLLNYHQYILAPLIQYAKYISYSKDIFLLETYSNQYQSELPLTFGYVLAPSMSVYNDTYLNANDKDRSESMKIMNLFANLIHNGDVNMKSSFCQNSYCENSEKWKSVFPELNFIILKDGQLTQKAGHYTDVHYLFNNLIPNQAFHMNLLNTWKTLYDVSNSNNISTEHSTRIPSSFLSKSIKSDMKNIKYIFLLTLSILIILIINFFICIILAKRGYCHRKREYNCLNGHKQLTIEKSQEHRASSPSSTNSNGTITQHLIVQTNCTTTTNSSLSSTPPVDMLHPINITKKNDILRCSSSKKTSFLPEAIV